MDKTCCPCLPGVSGDDPTGAGLCTATAQQLVPLLRGPLLRAVAAADIDCSPLQGGHGELERGAGAGLLHHHGHRHLGLWPATGAGTVAGGTPRGDPVECVRPRSGRQRRRLHHHPRFLPGLRQRRGRLQHVVKRAGRCDGGTVQCACASGLEWRTLYIVYE